VDCGSGENASVRKRASILHLDLDAFYASVEQRDKPSLRGKPVIVGGVGSRGVVATASYEARAFGVRSAMSTAEARARCPHAAFLTGRFDAYRATSARVMDILRAVSPLVEPLSLDEAYVDLAASPDRLDLTPAGLVDIGTRLKRAVAEATDGVTASVGVASSKLVAKIASEQDKPNGLVVVPPGEEGTLLLPLSVTALPGVGPATAERLRRIGVHTVAELQQVSLDELTRVVGAVHGASLYAFSRADDDRPVIAERETKSISVEDTFERDLVDPVLLASIVDRHARSVCGRLRAAKLSGRTVTVKVRLYDFTTSTRSASLIGPTDKAATVSRTARALLSEIDTSGGVRLLGVGVSGLADWIQDDLFDSDDAGEISTVSSVETTDPPRGAEPHVDDPEAVARHLSTRHLTEPVDRRWLPGMDVEHTEHGRGWVWGSGLGRVTVRFETAATAPGPVRTFATDDPQLRASSAHDVGGGPSPKLLTPLVRSDPMTDPQPLRTHTCPKPPVADRRPRRREHHGDVFVDDYEWLRDISDPETVAYLEAENGYTAATTAHLAELRERIYTEIKSRTQETDLSVPRRTGSYWYYRRTTAGKQYQVLCRLPVADGVGWTPPVLEPDVTVPGEEILLDCNELASESEFFTLGATDVSPDERLLAYSTDLSGAERYTIQVFDLHTKKRLPESIPNTLGSLAWSTDGAYLFYSTVDDAWRPHRVWRHAVGTEPSADRVVYEETDEGFWTSVSRTTSDRYLVISSSSKLTSEVRVLDASEPTDDFRVVLPRQHGVEYEVDHAVIAGDDRLLVLHNRDAENFTLGVGPVTLTTLDDLEPLIPPSDDIRVTDMTVSSTTLAVNLRQGGLPRVRIFDISADGIGAGRDLEFDEPMFDSAATGFSDWRSPLVRIAYSSWLTPSTVLDYDRRTDERHVRRQQPVLGGYRPEDYVQTREWATARDGSRVPISLVHARHVEPRSDSPLLLYGYGSYEFSVDPFLSVSRLSLLDRGMVFAVAHVRGGGEMGRHWYENGKLQRKKNTFTDFVDCARHLIDRSWTSSDKLVAMGASAGGLLMGAVANSAPDLFAGIVAQVPFVDALTSILDPALPLTVIEWDEWGDAFHDPAAYAYVKSYTPYENVDAQDYPAIYSLTSIHDTRVLYVEPAKWTARLRATATGNRPILLKCQMSAGHGGASGRYDAWRESADYLAWVLDVVGLAAAEPVPGQAFAEPPV
jgi:oligopeptidase B